MLDLERQFVCELLTNRTRARSLRSAMYFQMWRRSIRDGGEPLLSRTPWTTYQSISVLHRVLKPGTRVFEFGGGGSTLFCLDRGARVTTVDHDSNWFSKIRNLVVERNQSRQWEGVLIAPTTAPSAFDDDDRSDPDAYTSGSVEFKGLWFKDYASFIDSFIEDSFDVIIIDGRSRPSCLKHSIRKVKVGGLLFLDNTERDYYLTPKTLEYLKSFVLCLDEFGPTQGLRHFTKTTVWRRVA